MIQKTLQGECSDRLPRAIFGAGLWAYRQAGLKPKQVVDDPVRFANSLAAVFEGLDTDIVFLGSGLNTFPAEAIGGALAFRDAQAPLLSFPVIQETEDARFFETVHITDSPHTRALVEMIAVIRERLPDHFLCATSWGPFTWAMILCEWNLLQEKVMKDRLFIREVCELGIRLSMAFFTPLIERGLIDGISIPDGAVTLLPLDLYRDVVLPCEKKIFDKVRERGVWGFLHQCGKIRSQVPFYPETGADCISVDAGVAISEVYELYRERVVTAGNVDVINTIFGGDPAQLCSAVSQCIEGMPYPYRRFILMPSCDLPPDTPMLNVTEFLACADRHSP